LIVLSIVPFGSAHSWLLVYSDSVLPLDGLINEWVNEFSGFLPAHLLAVEMSAVHNFS